MTIGVVAEGKSDFEVISALIYKTCPEAIVRQIQPSIDAIDQSRGEGWKGVWKWCIESDYFIDELNKISSHRIDFFIIHLDGDTTREKQFHCIDSTSCSVCAVDSALLCGAENKDCPLEINNDFKQLDIETKYTFLENKIDEWITHKDSLTLFKCLPFDSIEAWVVAAFDKEKHGSPELIEKPAETIIAHKKEYHGIRVHRYNGKLKKSKLLYTNHFIPKLCEEWKNVQELCRTAKYFQTTLNSIST